MKQAKDNKGISLIVLAITIMIMVLLAGVTISTGQKQVNTSKEQKLIAELDMVKHAVYEKYATYTKTKNTQLLIGEKITSSEAQTLATSIGVTLITIPNNYNENERAYYRLNSNNLEILGIYDSQDTYVVNYVTGEVINETKKSTNSGKVLYTYSRAIFSTEDVTAF